MRDVAKRQLRRVMEVGQRVGVHIQPAHMYAEVPDLRSLRSRRAWRVARSMHGVRGADLNRQEEQLSACFSPAISRYLASVDVYGLARDASGEDGFGPVEAEALFAFVAKHRPSRIVQVGCGLSTAVMLEAAKFARYVPNLVAVDPNPSEFLLGAGRSGQIELEACGAERIDDLRFEALGSGDLLFVDSTHASTPGGEVNRILLEVVPRLPGGVWAHFHDINFPYDYSRELLAGDLFFPHESVLLHALLVSNVRLSVGFSMSMLHYGRPDAIRRVLPRYRPASSDHGLCKGRRKGRRKRSADLGHFPSSIFLRANGSLSTEVGGLI